MHTVREEMFDGVWLKPSIGCLLKMSSCLISYQLVMVYVLELGKNKQKEKRNKNQRKEGFHLESRRSLFICT